MYFEWSKDNLNYMEKTLGPVRKAKYSSTYIAVLQYLATGTAVLTKKYWGDDKDGWIFFFWQRIKIVERFCQFGEKQ